MRGRRLAAGVAGALLALLAAQGAAAQYPLTGATDCADTFDEDGDRTTIFSPGGEIQIRGVAGCAAPNEQDIEAIFSSSPVLLARFDAHGDGSYISPVVTIPRDASSGRHNVFVRTASNEYVQPISISGARAVPRGLPRTGTDTALLAVWGFVLLVFGSLLVTATWRWWRTARADARMGSGGEGLERLDPDEARPISSGGGS